VLYFTGQTEISDLDCVLLEIGQVQSVGKKDWVAEQSWRREERQEGMGKGRRRRYGEGLREWGGGRREGKREEKEERWLWQGLELHQYTEATNSIGHDLPLTPHPNSNTNKPSASIYTQHAAVHKIHYIKGLLSFHKELLKH
jgi:hypothetical protein